MSPWIATTLSFSTPTSTWQPVPQKRHGAFLHVSFESSSGSGTLRAVRSDPNAAAVAAPIATVLMKLLRSTVIVALLCGSRRVVAGTGDDDVDDADAFLHYDRTISVIVSPADCARCHARQVEEFAGSHHSKAGRILGSLDNVLAEVVEGNRGMVTAMFPEGNSAAAVRRSSPTWSTRRRRRA
jgi:hypothetical protein